MFLTQTQLADAATRLRQDAAAHACPVLFADTDGQTRWTPLYALTVTPGGGGRVHKPWIFPGQPKRTGPGGRDLVIHAYGAHGVKGLQIDPETGAIRCGYCAGTVPLPVLVPQGPPPQE